MYKYFLDDDASDAVIVRGNVDTRDEGAAVRGGGAMAADRGMGLSSYDEELTHVAGGGSSSVEDEVDSTSSRDMNFSVDRESIDNRLRDYYEHTSDNSSDEGEDGGGRAPEYRQSVTTNWSSSDEETEKYREHRSSLFRRSETETSSPDYFLSPSRGELIRLLVSARIVLIVTWIVIIYSPLDLVKVAVN